jgi:hypothetical protein
MSPDMQNLQVDNDMHRVKFINDGVCNVYVLSFFSVLYRVKSVLLCGTVRLTFVQISVMMCATKNLSRSVSAILVLYRSRTNEMKS